MIRKLAVSLMALISLVTGARAEVPVVGAVAPEFSLPDQHGVMRRLAESRKAQASVVGVSVDDTASHKAFAEKYHLPFPLLTDSNAEVAKRYGALPDWLVVKLAKRYTFLIDPAGRIAKAYLSADASRHSAEIIKDLKTLQGGKQGLPASR